MEAIVPEIIPTIPQNIIRINYPSGVEVNLGNELTPASVKDEPIVEWSAEPNALYTLIMVDPDAPTGSEPERRGIKHWLVINIPGNNVKKGETLAGYRGSAPRKDSGFHRYVFVVYKQSESITCTELPVSSATRNGRIGFNVKSFADKYKLGEAVAVNYYRAQYDEYVDAIRAQFAPRKTM